MLKFLAVIACIAALATPSQANNKATNRSGASQTSQPDQRGTQSSPLEANVHTVQSEKESANEGAKYEWEKEINRWNVGLTFAIALCALAQVFVYIFQTRLIGKTLNEIHSQAEHTKNQVELMREQIALQRAERRGVLEVNSEPLEVSVFAEEGTWALVGVIRLTNCGDFPLQNREGSGGFLFERSDTVDIVGSRERLDCEKVWIRPKGRGHVEIFHSPNIRSKQSEFGIAG